MACALDLYMTFVLRIGHMHNANTFAHMFSSKWSKSGGSLDDTDHHKHFTMDWDKSCYKSGLNPPYMVHGDSSPVPKRLRLDWCASVFFRTCPHSICSSNSAAYTEWTPKHWLNICCAYFGNAKNIETFQYAGRFMGILVMADYDPHVTNWEVSSHDIPCINYYSI